MYTSFWYILIAKIDVYHKHNMHHFSYNITFGDIIVSFFCSAVQLSDAAFEDGEKCPAPNLAFPLISGLYGSWEPDTTWYFLPIGPNLFSKSNYLKWEVSINYQHQYFTHRPHCKNYLTIWVNIMGCYSSCCVFDLIADRMPSLFWNKSLVGNMWGSACSTV